MKRLVARADRPTPLRRVLRKAFPLLPESMLGRALRQKDIRRGGIRLSGEELIQDGDILEVYIGEKYLYAMPEIAYQDDRLVVLVKPRGIPSVGQDSLQEALKALYPAWTACHRLDAQTGGLILFAKDSHAFIEAADAFRADEVKKTYRARVLGAPDPSQAELRAYLLKDAKAARVRVVDQPRPGARPIHTGYQTIAELGGVSELSIRLHTGRTHQIRAQMAHIGHPVLGDDLYGSREANRRFCARRLMLWASELEVNARGEALSALRGRRIASVPPWEEGANLPDV